jgi:hypothetical protein
MKPERETKLGGPAFPDEILEKHPELGFYDFTPNSIRWLEVPGMVQMVLGTFVPGKGWLVTKRGVIYGGRHGPPPLIADDVDKVVEHLLPELRSGIRAMKKKIVDEA